MKHPLITRSFLILASLCAVCVGSVRADIIYGNLGAYTNDGGQDGAGSQINAVNSGGNNMVAGKGIGFTMGLASYSVTSLTLRLNNVNDNPDVDVPTVSIYTVKAGTAGSGGTAGQANTLVGTFINPSFTAGITAANYTFTPAASITLNAGTRYLIIVRQLNFVTDTIQEFNWLNGSPTVTPTGVAGSGYAVFGGTSNPSSWTSSSTQFNWFQLDGTSAIPEPSTYAAFAGIASLGLVVMRRSRRQRLS